MLNVDLTLLKLNKLCVRIISSSVLASLGILLGLAPQVSVQSSIDDREQLVTISDSTFAVAQEVSPEETNNYAQAAFEVEMLRREIYQEVKKIIDRPPGDIVCDRQETLEDLDPQVRALTESYCNQTLEIVQQNNLSGDRYNELTSYYNRRDTFYQEVQKILLKLQK